jgi:hypothetical protein
MWQRDPQPADFDRFSVAAVLIVLFVLLYIGGRW